MSTLKDNIATLRTIVRHGCMNDEERAAHMALLDAVAACADLGDELTREHLQSLLDADQMPIDSDVCDRCGRTRYEHEHPGKTS